MNRTDAPVRAGDRVRLVPSPYAVGAAFAGASGIVESVARVDGVDCCTLRLDDGSVVTVPTSSTTRSPAPTPRSPAGPGGRRSSRRHGALAEDPGWSEPPMFDRAGGGAG